MTQREEFEIWCASVGLPYISLLFNGKIYADGAIQNMWQSWKAAKAQAVPEGYRLMPPEPTPEMIEAWRESPFSDDYEENLASGYDAMFLAAPEQNK